MRVIPDGAEGRSRIAPYAPLERHGMIGDRRTAALVAADGTIDWLCVPGWAGDALFGALLDVKRGGHFRLGPAALAFGRQEYVPGTAVLTTRWSAHDFELELTDAMELPADDGGEPEDHHVLLRRLRCVRGRASCVLGFRPRHDFGPVEGLPPATLWRSHPVDRFELERGETVWAVLDVGGPHRWSPARAQRVLDATMERWRAWTGGIQFHGRRAAAVRHSAMLVHLMDSTPYGSPVAAPTTSLPERLGGGGQADYRLAWVRDASLAVRCLASLQHLDGARHYLDWLVELPIAREGRLQPLYGLDGNPRPKQHVRSTLYGHRGSRPVRFGNQAWHQRQVGSIGFLADCLLTYLEHGGRWTLSYRELLGRIADHTALHWPVADNGLWELDERRHFVSSRVMSWVVLDRATRIVSRLGERPPERWVLTRDAIHRDVLEHGYSDKLGAFRQSYERHFLDAATLLIPLMGFLPPDDPRVRRTVDRISEQLTLDGFVFRFPPKSVPFLKAFPMGEAEGAFLPCTFWLASARALEGRADLADEILSRTEAIAGPVGLFAEAVDPRTRSFMGNGPLLFSQLEYVRAVQLIEQARRRHPRHAAA
jgi:GH15 family glucan-1,4-alpha-glucosidase